MTSNTCTVQAISAGPRPPAWSASWGPVGAAPPAARSGAVARAIRMVLAIVTAVALLAMVVEGRSAPGPPSGVADAPAVKVVQPFHVVMPGETLWSIAAGLRPGTDPRPLVDTLVAARGSSTILVGERIQLPPGL